MLPAIACCFKRIRLHQFHQFAGIHPAAARANRDTGAGSATITTSSISSSSSSTGEAAAALPEGVIVLPMPSLSHAMVSGKVKKWLKQEGEQCNMYDLVLEVETETLVEEAYRLDDFAGKVTLLIEANEECWLAKKLLQAGQEVPVGHPIAMLSEDEEGMQQAAVHAAAVAKVSSVYAEDSPGRSIRTMVWQSYLKESKNESGSSCGCM